MESCAPASSRARKPIVVWNITRTCNLNACIVMQTPLPGKFKGELDWDQCCAVIDDLADYKVNALLFPEGAAGASALYGTAGTCHMES